MYWVYILKSRDYQKSYIGYTDNVERRLQEHNSGRTAFTKKYKPWEVIHRESFTNITDAIQREKFLKSRSGRRFLKSVIFV